jgi:hypothetical protein
MKTIQRFLIGTTLVISMMAAGTAWADPPIGGNVILNRLNVDGLTNFYLVDTNQPIHGHGRLTHWEMWAENTNPVQLVIYRQEGDVFSVVDTSDVEIPSVGYNQFELHPRIRVRNGDFIGVYHPNAGSVSFTLDPPGSFLFVPPADPNGGSVRFTASGGLPTAFTGSSNRTYSIRAFRED